MSLIECNICEASFEDDIQLKNHNKNYHQKSIAVSYSDIEGKQHSIKVERDENEEFTCPICFYSTNVSSSFRSHFNRLQGNCGSSAPTLNTFIDDVEFFMRPTRDNKYKCVLCQEYVAKIEDHYLKKHTNHKIDVCVSNKKRTIRSPSYDALFYDRDNDFKRIRAEPIMRGFGLDLISIDTNNQENTMITTALVNEKACRLYRSLPQLFNSSSNSTVLFSNNTKTEEELTVLDLKNMIKKSGFPGINDKLGPYIEINNEIEKKIGKLDLKHAISVFAGSIIVSDDFILLVLSAEIYSRNGYEDAHAEKSGSSYPESLENSSKRNCNWKVCVVKEGEGGDQITKLVVGTEEFNVLITGSLMVSPICEDAVAFGPRCHNLLPSLKKMKCSLFFQKKKIESLGESTESTQNDRQCRQLNSAFSHKSTYFLYRANLFESNLRQPVTLFTLYLIPNNGYGSSSSSSCREISFFFSYVFDCHHGLKNLKDIGEYFSDDLSDKKLDAMVKNIKAIVNRNNENEVCNILKVLSNQKGVSALAQSVSGSLSSANKKLANITLDYVKELFNN